MGCGVERQQSQKTALSFESGRGVAKQLWSDSAAWTSACLWNEVARSKIGTRYELNDLQLGDNDELIAVSRVLATGALLIPRAFTIFPHTFLRRICIDLLSYYDLLTELLNRHTSQLVLRACSRGGLGPDRVTLVSSGWTG
jgi:hypothetical protein